MQWPPKCQESTHNKMLYFLVEKRYEKVLECLRIEYNSMTMKTNSIITKNSKAFFNYDISKTFEAGVVLEGWEVKALRAGKGQLTDGHIVVRNGELFMLGCRIAPFFGASTHVETLADRTRKLLLRKVDIVDLIGKVAQKSFTLVPLDLHWNQGRIKCTMALAKGKGDYDKRIAIKEREGKREVERVMKTHRI